MSGDRPHPRRFPLSKVGNFLYGELSLSNRPVLAAPSQNQPIDSMAMDGTDKGGINVIEPINFNSLYRFARPAEGCGKSLYICGTLMRSLPDRQAQRRRWPTRRLEQRC
jgi:hypothetical protein